MEDNKKEVTIEEAFGKLEGILDQMQSEDLSLEDTFALYKKGVSLVETCSKKIEKIQCEVVKLSADSDKE